MKKTIYIALILTFISSCGCERNAKPVEVKANSELISISKKIESQFPVQEVPNQDNVDTRYEYTDDNGNSVIVENSYPRGGQVYTAPKGERYIYAVFWTRITNNTTDSLMLTIEFLEEYQLPSSPDRVFKLLIPTDTLAIDKEISTNYGLDLERYLNGHLYEQNDLKKIIKPNDCNGFYVVTLFNKGVEGTLRTGLTIEKDKILYRVNDKAIDCGRINLKKLKEKKPAHNKG